MDRFKQSMCCSDLFLNTILPKKSALAKKRCGICGTELKLKEDEGICRNCQSILNL